MSDGGKCPERGGPTAPDCMYAAGHEGPHSWEAISHDERPDAEAKAKADEEARAQAADDQWRASVVATASQAKVFYDALTDADFPDESAAIIVGHWLAASVMGAPMTQMVQRFMAITEDPEEGS